MVHAVVTPLLARVAALLQQPQWSAIRTLEHRADALEVAATRASQRLEHQENHEGAAVAPLLLDVVATQHAALRAAARRDQQTRAEIEEGQSSLAELWRRVEVVRREVLFELRYGPAETVRGPEVTMEPKILNVAKVEAMGDDLFLNVGSGSLCVDGYLNVDIRAIDGVDVVADVGGLPFDDGTVAEVRSSHVLEHFPQEELRRRVLPHWVGKLRPGGTLRAVVPDAVSMMRACAAGAVSFEDLREVTFGGQDYEGDFHFTMFSVESLTLLLEQAGLVEVEVVADGRRNGMCLEMELVARKPDDGSQRTPG